MLSEEIIAGLVKDFYDLVSQIDNSNRLQSPPLTADEHSKLLSSLAGHREATAAELGRGDFGFAELGANAVAMRAGLSPNAIERRQIQQAIMRAGLEAIKAAEARLSGDFSYVPADPVLPSQPANVTPRTTSSQHDRGMAYTPVAGSNHSGTRPPADVGGRSTATAQEHKTKRRLSELTTKFLLHQRNGRLWDAQTALQAGKSYRLFVELCGDAEPHRYNRADAQNFKETMQALPADYGKAAEFRGKTLGEIDQIDRDRGGKVERLSTRTVKRHFSALSGFWRWAIKEKFANENLFSGFSFPSALRANEQRDMWTAEELTELFATPVWAGCLSEGRRSTPGELIIRDEKYWLPLIAIYSGLRQEEIAQLHIEDVRKVEGHLVFDINGRPPRKLKNRTAVRKVPVHSELIRLGLLDYIDAQQRARQVRLFSSLSPGGADERLGHAFSKWFARYRQQVGMYRKGLDFHSFRHTATTLMQRSGVGIAIIDELTGHVTPGETARYSHGSTVDQLAAGIEAITIKLLLASEEKT